MAKKIEFEAKRLLKMVKDGVAQSEIMKKFGFNTSTQLKVAYTNALDGGRGNPRDSKSARWKASRRGQKGSRCQQAGQSDPSQGID
jgi:hypothetical protein